MQKRERKDQKGRQIIDFLESFKKTRKRKQSQYNQKETILNAAKK